MNTIKRSLTIAVLIAITIVITGCSGGADSLFEASFKVLPKAHAYVGKDAKDISEKALKTSLARTAMDEKVATTTTDVKTIIGF